MDWTLTNYDTMDRPVSVYSIPGTSVPACGSGQTGTGHTQTMYNNATTFNSLPAMMTQFTDQDGKRRQTITDGLDRATGVIEDPSGANYKTSYWYDVLVDLNYVQQGLEVRQFYYDSLWRLTSSWQPEPSRTQYRYGQTRRPARW